MADQYSIIYMYPQFLKQKDQEPKHTKKVKICGGQSRKSNIQIIRVRGGEKRQNKREKNQRYNRKKYPSAGEICFRWKESHLASEQNEQNKTKIQPQIHPDKIWTLKGKKQSKSLKKKYLQRRKNQINNKFLIIDNATRDNGIISSMLGEEIILSLEFYNYPNNH